MHDERCRKCKSDEHLVEHRRSRKGDGTVIIICLRCEYIVFDEREVVRKRKGGA